MVYSLYIHNCKLKLDPRSVSSRLNKTFVSTTKWDDMFTQSCQCVNHHHQITTMNEICTTLVLDLNLQWNIGGSPTMKAITCVICLLALFSLALTFDLPSPVRIYTVLVMYSTSLMCLVFNPSKVNLVIYLKQWYSE